jgi:hypothetical protein
MQTREVVEIKTAVVITGGTLEECHRVLRDVAEKARQRITAPSETFGVEYTARLADGARVTFASFEELFNYSNRWDRRLVAVTCRTEPRFRSDVTRVELELGRGVATVFSAVIEGEVGEALSIKELCKNIQARVRTGYGWMYLFPLELTYFGIGALALSLFILMCVTFVEKGLETFNTLGIVAALLFPAMTLGALSRGFLFPRTVFEIGQEVERQATRKGIRKWVLTAIVLGVPLALLIRWMAGRAGI